MEGYRVVAMETAVPVAGWFEKCPDRRFGVASAA
jgi:hypothetical protein